MLTESDADIEDCASPKHLDSARQRDSQRNKGIIRIDRTALGKQHQNWIDILTPVIGLMGILRTIPKLL